MCSFCRDRNSCEDETCNSRSVLVNICLFFFQVPYLKRGLKKAIGLTTTVHWHHAFLYVSLPSLNNYDT